MPPPVEPIPKRQKLSPTDTTNATGQTDTTSQTDRVKPSPDSKSAWFGTWSRKAVPSTQVARESIASSNGVRTPEPAPVSNDGPLRSEMHSRNASLALTLGKRVPNKALPADVTTTRDHAISSRRGKDAHEKSKRSEQDKTTRIDGVRKKEQKGENSDVDDGTSQTNEPAVSDPPLTAADTVPEQPAKSLETQQTSGPQSWIGWLAGSRLEISQDKTEPDQDKREDTMKSTMTVVAPTEAIASAPQEADKPVNTEEMKATPTQTAIDTTQRRSWLPYWGNSTTPQSAPAIITAENATKQAASPATQSQMTTISGVSQPPDTNKNTEPPTSPVEACDSTTETKNPQINQKSPAWIFWSRDVPAASKTPKSEERAGEVAVAETSSQDKPRRASIKLDTPVQSETTRMQPKPPQNASESVKSTAPATPAGKENKKARSERSKSQDLTSTTSAATLNSNKASASAIDVDRRVASSSPARPKKDYDHQLLPAFLDTIKFPEHHSLLQRLGGLLSTPKQPERRHVDLVERTSKVKNALAIGVHGYFPAPLLRSVLGQPTGTSIKFAEMAAQAVKRWSKSQGYDCKVKTAALEGEGKISERLDLLWKLLLNWIEEIRRADFVLVACHSQGVPVAVMLVAKLIHFGCVSSAQVGICAMAGVNMGPFPEYKSRWIGGSAAELFDFSEPDSKVSKDYLAALEEVLRFGAKITYVGSIDDQLVSLESALFSPISHPHIYRAVSIDSKVHAPSFLSHLVGFVLKLRNLGVHDHGLIRELSSPLAGSLYASEGHSRIYEDPAIYDLAIAFTLLTTSLTGQPISQTKVKTTEVSNLTATATSTSNPYILPFAMRGVIEEDYVKTHLQDEVDDLLREFDRWQPTTKQLKDVKFRLEGIRSRL